MPDLVRQSGRTSRWAYALQSVQGTYVAPTDYYNASTFELSVNPNTEVIESLTGFLDSQSEAIAGIAEITGKVSGPFRGLQGMAFLKALIGADTFTTASSSFSTLSGATIVGATSITLVSSAPAPPAGITDWIGAPLVIDTAGNAETVTILSVAGTTVKISAAAKAHASGVVVGTPTNLHCFQPRSGASAATLDYLSFVGQFARIGERQAVDSQVFEANIKGSADKAFTVDYMMVMQAALNFDGAFTTTIPTSATEAADKGFRAQFGALYTYGAAADTVMSAHKRMVDFDWKLSIKDDKISEGGNPQAVVQHIPSARTGSLSWTDNAGEAAFSTFFADFVNVYRETPALLAWLHPNTGYYVSIYHPRNVAMTYDYVGPSDNPIQRKGTLTPLLDLANTGLLVRAWVQNGTTTTY